MNCLPRQKNFLYSTRELNCDNLNYRAKNHVVIFCFGLQWIARFINTKHTQVGGWLRKIFLKLLNLSRKKIKMLFTGFGRSVLGETVPLVWVLKTSGTVSPNTDRPEPVNIKHIYNFAIYTNCSMRVVYWPQKSVRNEKFTTTTTFFLFKRACGVTGLSL